MRKIPKAVLREAWLAGTKAVRKEYIKLHGLTGAPSTWNEPEDIWTQEPMYQAGARAYAKVFLSYLARTK